MTYIFEHIFKTAGTTFYLGYLPAAFAAEEFLVLRADGDWAQHDPSEGRLQDQTRRPPHKIIVGHNAGMLRSSYPDAHFLTLCRDPVERAISGYLHAKHHTDAWDAIGKEIHDGQIGIAEFIERDLFAAKLKFTSFHDYQTQVILGGKPAAGDWPSKATITEALRSRFHLVGYSEALELFLFMLHLECGFPLGLFNNRLVRKERASFRLTEADIATIERHSQLDKLVYQTVREEFDRRLERVWTVKTEAAFNRFRDALRQYQALTTDDPSAKPQQLYPAASILTCADDTLPVPGLFSLEDLHVCVQANVSGSLPLVVVTPPERWSYAVMIPVHVRGSHVAGAEGVSVQIKAKVEGGRVGFAIAEADHQTWLGEERELWRHHGEAQIELSVPLEKARWIIIRNVAPDGPSKLYVYSIGMFRKMAVR